jgi:hypothetical protein
MGNVIIKWLEKERGKKGAKRIGGVWFGDVGVPGLHEKAPRHKPRGFSKTS